ncbi:MAG: acetylxylan esterase [Janthinobacterium lividum]
MRPSALQNTLAALLLSAAPTPFCQVTVSTPPPAAGPQRLPIAQQLTFTPYHASGIYKVGDLVGWTVTPGPSSPVYSFRYTIRQNNAVALKEGKLNLISGKDTIEITGDRPEMIYVAVEPYAVLDTTAAATSPTPSGEPDLAASSPSNSAARSVTDAAAGAPPPSPYTGGNTGRNNGLYAVGAAVAPLQIPMDTPRPADFDTFWTGKLAQQERVPVHASLVPATSEVPGVALSMFTLDALGSRVHGYVAKPAREGKFPAMIQLQYAGVYALNARMDEQRAAPGWLVVNVDSHDKQPNDPSGGVPRDYQTVGNSDRETSYFLNMYLRDSRALDYLLTRPDWDGKTIILTGGSMGGQQSLALAGLRPDKITGVLVCVPAGADTNGDLHGRKAGYPNWPSGNPDIMRTALYFDPVNFASRITAPVMAGMGFIDTIAPPTGIWTALNQIRAPKEPLPMVWSEHDNMTPREGHACPARTSQILDQIVKGSTYTPAPLKP